MNQNLKKQPLISHLEDLRWHLARCLVAVIIGSIITFLNKSFIFDNIIFACKNNNFPVRGLDNNIYYTTDFISFLVELLLNKKRPVKTGLFCNK